MTTIMGWIGITLIIVSVYMILTSKMHGVKIWILGAACLSIKYILAGVVELALFCAVMLGIVLTLEILFKKKILIVVKRRNKLKLQYVASKDRKND